MTKATQLARCAAISLLLASLATAQSYTVTDVGTLPGGVYSNGFAINSSGHIVGCSDAMNQCNSNISGDGFFWTFGGIQKLPSEPGSSFPTIAHALNDFDQIVGESGTRAVAWTKEKNLQLIGGFQGPSAAFGTNNRGEVVGYANSGSPHYYDLAFFWSSSLGTVELGSIYGAFYSYAFDVNSSSEVVGVAGSGIQGSDHAFFWIFPRGMQDLGTLPGGGSYSSAWHINDSHQIVGGSCYSNSGYNTHAVLWTPDKKIHDLGALPGDACSFALSINGSGVVVGDSSADCSYDNHAFVWSRSAGMQDLNNLIPANSGWLLNTASGINASGQITGVGTLNGESRAFLLTPSGTTR